MASPKRRTGRPDVNQTAFAVVQHATSMVTGGRQPETPQGGARIIGKAGPPVHPAVPAPMVVGKNPAAVALGKLGGAKGGKARAAALSPKKRSAIAKKAARARWAKLDS